jgi:hypothetical protein
LLPRGARQPVRDHWYRNASPAHSQHLNSTESYYPLETGITYKTADPLAELYAMLKVHAAPITSPRYAIASSGLKGAPLASLVELSGVRGRAISHFPETAFLTVRGVTGGDRYFTVLSNNALANVAELFGEEKRRLPDEDTLTVVNGFIGAYPNAFFSVDVSELPGFVGAMRSLASEADYRQLLARYGIRRTDERFWDHSDALMGAYRRWAPKEAALFDYNRFENR